MALTKVTYSMISGASLNVKDFGAVGDGVTDDTAAIQAAFNTLSAYTNRSIYFPPGTYAISNTLTAVTGLTSAQFIGASGYDGTRGPLNNSLRTSLKWIGSTNAATAMVKFDQANGVLWRGISLNCNYKAGYGLQFMSSSLTSGSIKNIIENCSIHYALADGILIGSETNSPVAPGTIQFFGNVFRNLTMYGCARSGIHINEWNADQQLFDTVMVYLDDAATPQNTLNAFWFQNGGQQSVLINCESGGMTVVSGVAGSGFAILNGNPSVTSNAGAHGLTVIGLWQEGAGGLYYGVTSTEDGKGFTFLNCNSFTSNTANYSVFIDKGTTDQIPYTFVGCNFLSNLKINSSSFSGQYLNLTNCNFASGQGVLSYENDLVQNGVYVAGTVSAGSVTFPAFANLIQVTLGGNISVVYDENNFPDSKITIIVTQDATGSRTITWGSEFSNLPPIPSPNSVAGSKTVYNFISNGTVFYLTSSQQ